MIEIAKYEFVVGLLTLLFVLLTLLFTIVETKTIKTRTLLLWLFGISLLYFPYLKIISIIDPRVPSIF